MEDTKVALSEEAGLEKNVADVGRGLRDTLGRIVDALPGSPHSPQSLVRALGVDKVFGSRLLKALRMKDPVAVAFHMPGPEPLRRLLRSASSKGAGKADVRAAEATVAQLEELIRAAGDRSSLDALISAWLPEARRGFELRRKQSVFKAMSQLKGMVADTTLATVLLHPSDDGESIDIVWVMGLLGFHRLRPGVTAKLATRRLLQEGAPRQPCNLDGDPIRSIEDARLDQFCDAPPAELAVRRIGEVHQYLLAGDEFGPRSAVDLVFVEVNRQEMPRFVPAGSGRKGNVFAEIAVPSKNLLFDVLVHEDLYPRSDPGLVIYDTAYEGVANVNDPARDSDRFDLAESIQTLGRGTGVTRDARIPSYVDLLRHLFRRLAWSDLDFRVYRCAVDYPLYGSQVTMTFDAPSAPEG